MKKNDKMKKYFSIVLVICSIILVSWKTEKTKVNVILNCNPVGMYTGESKSNKGTVSSMTYDLKENNLAVGMTSATGGAVTFGGYKTDCDTIVISVCYTANMSYYLLKGKFSEDKTTIKGTFQNRASKGDNGTFEISKL